MITKDGLDNFQPKFCKQSAEQMVKFVKEKKIMIFRKI